MIVLDSIINEVKETTSNFDKYPLCSFTIESGVIPKTDRYERGFLVKKDGDLFKIVHPNNFVMNPMNLRFGAINYSKLGTDVSVSGYYDIFNIDEGLFNSFWSSYLRTPKTLNRYNSIATGSLVEKKRVHFSQLKELKFYIPSNEEKTKINDFINLLEQRIDTQIKIINNLKSQRKEVFVDFWRKSKEYKIKISDLGIVRKGSALSKNDLTKNGTPCILYGEIFTKYELIIDNIVSKTTKNDNSLKSCGNELIFPSSTTVDAISLVKPVALKHKNIILGGDLFSIRIYADKYDLLYICCLINYVYNKKIAERCQGSTIIHLYYDDIKDIEIQICDFTKQKYISTLIKNISTKIKIEEEVLNKLNIQKSYLLRNLFI